MAEELDDGEFWLPSQFLTEEDILMDFKGSAPELTPSGSSTSLSSDTASSPIDDSSFGGSRSGKAESSEDDDDIFTALTHQVCGTFLAEDFSSDDSPKGSISPTSPQSTLRPVSVHSVAGPIDVWGVCGTSTESPNGSISPPPTAEPSANTNLLLPDDSALEALNAALKEMTRLSMVPYQYQQKYGGTGFFDSSRGAPPSPSPTNFKNRYAAPIFDAPIPLTPNKSSSSSGGEYNDSRRGPPFLGGSISDGKEHIRDLVQVQNSLQNQIRSQLQAIEIMKSERRLNAMSGSKPPADRRPYYQPSDFSSRVSNPRSSSSSCSSEDSLTTESSSDTTNSRPPLGLPPSAWPPLQQNNQQHPKERRPPQSRSVGPRSRAVVYPADRGPVWMRDSVGGTGVFIPKRPISANSGRGGALSQIQPPRKNVGSRTGGSVGSTAPPRVQRAAPNLNMNNCDYDKLDWSLNRVVEDNNNGCAGFGFRRIVNNNSNSGGSQQVMGEIQLPAEWSY